MHRLRVAGTALFLSAASLACGTGTADAAPIPALVAGPVGVSKSGPFAGYVMAVEAAPVAGRATVAVEFGRARSSALQSAVFVFFLPRRALHISRDLRHATLDTGSALRQFGRIRLTFACATHAPNTRRCLGSARRRSGTLTGSVVFRTHAGLQVRLRSLPARLMRKKLALTGTTPSVGLGSGSPVIQRPNCRQYRRASVVAIAPAKSSSPDGFALAGMLAARTRSGRLVALIAMTRRRSPATEIAAVQVSARRSALRLRGTQAAQFGARGVPLIKGRVSFVRTAPLPGCPGRGAIGTATGALRVNFGMFGTHRLLSDGSRTPGLLIVPASG